MLSAKTSLGFAIALMNQRGDEVAGMSGGAPGIARRGLIAVIAAASASALSACGSRVASAAPTTQLRIVGLIVEDLGRSVAFYRALGLDLPASAKGDSYRHRFDNGDVLFWETPSEIRRFDSEWSPPPKGDRRVVLEFGFDSPARLRSVYERLDRAYGAGRLAPFDQGAGVTYAIVTDPDGNQVSLRNPATG